MTKSSQRKDKILGRPSWLPTDEKCEECNGEMVQTSPTTYSCTVCGLMQVRKHKLLKRKKKKK